MRKVAFRVDSSMEIGNGHVMRCLTLADTLQALGAECFFICRSNPGDLIEKIRDRGFDVAVLARASETPQPTAELPPYAHWLGASSTVDAEETARVLRDRAPCDLVIDHYAIDQTWELQVRPYCRQLAVIDDLADRRHDCDLLIDQSPGREPTSYAELVPQRCTLLCGTPYALLRPEFKKWRDYSLARRKTPKLQRLLITMGGVDSENLSGQILDALKRSPLPKECRVTVVLGPQAAWLQDLHVRSRDLPWPCDVQVDVGNMAQLMAESDIAIGAGGITALERCVLGLPTLILIAAENQRCNAQALYEAHAAILTDIESIPASLRRLIAPDSADQLTRMVKAASSVCDGYGAHRVAFNMSSLGCHVRSMVPADLAMVLAWRNSDRVRHFMRTRHEITQIEHETWFHSLTDRPDHHLLIVENANGPFGFAHLREGRDGWAEWGFYVAPESPSGSGKALGVAILSHAFRNMAIRGVFGDVDAANHRSIALHKWLGFQTGQPGQQVTSPQSVSAMLRFEINAEHWR